MLLHAFCFVDRINLWNAARHMIGNPSLWHFAFFINTKQGDCSEWSIIILSWKTECLNYSREIKLLLQSGSRRGDLGACLFMVNNAWWHPDETMNQHLSDSAHNWCTKCRLLAHNFLPMYLKIMGNFEKATGVLQTVSVAKCNEPAWDTWVVDMKLKKKSSLILCLLVCYSINENKYVSVNWHWL